MFVGIKFDYFGLTSDYVVENRLYFLVSAMGELY